MIIIRVRAGTGKEDNCRSPIHTCNWNPIREYRYCNTELGWPWTGNEAQVCAHKAHNVDDSDAQIILIALIGIAR